MILVGGPHCGVILSFIYIYIYNQLVSFLRIYCSIFDGLDFANLFPNSAHQARCLAFSGTLILKGSATCIVYATGDRTFLGALRVPIRLVGLMLVVISDGDDIYIYI